MIYDGVNMDTGRKHSIAFGDGTLYPSESAGRMEGQFKPTVGHTYNDWFLIPSSRPSVAMPGTDAKFIQLPGVDGDLDLSQWIRKDRPAYRNRSGSFEFYVENDHAHFKTIFEKVYNNLHGKKFKMVLADDDPGYYYEGRFAVSENRSDPNWSTIKIDYNLQPWKRRVRKAQEKMVWDTFDFETDYDYDPWGLDSVVVSGSRDLDLWGDGYPWQPEIVVAGGGSITVQFGGKTATVTGSEVTEGILGRAAYGPNTLRLIGNATVSVNWRGGSL